MSPKTAKVVGLLILLVGVLIIAGLVAVLVLPMMHGATTSSVNAGAIIVLCIGAVLIGFGALIIPGIGAKAALNDLNVTVGNYVPHRDGGRPLDRVVNAAEARGEAVVSLVTPATTDVHVEQQPPAAP